MKIRNIIFIHIPRTSGTNFERCLGFEGHDKEPRCGSKNYGANYKELMGWDKKTKTMLQHLTYKQMLERKYIDEDNDLIKISIVRNPYDRIISLYKYFGGKKKWESFEKFLNYIEEQGRNYYFYKPQFKYLEGCDFNLIKFESFQQDLEAINKKLDLDIKCDFDTKRHEGRDNSSYLTKENLVKINEIYKKDFINYGYDFIHTSSKTP